MHNQVMSVHQFGLGDEKLDTLQERYWKLSDVGGRIRAYLDLFRDFLDPYGEPPYEPILLDEILVKQQMAIAKDLVSPALDWLFGPPSDDSRVGTSEARFKEFENSFISMGRSAREARSMAKILSRRTGEPVGRPRTTGPNAIRALTRYLRSPMTYRQIYFEINGACADVCPLCKDAVRKCDEPSGIRIRKPRERCANCGSTIRKEAQREQVCGLCNQTLIKSVYRLEKYLREIKIHPEIPRWVELQKLDPQELERWYWDHPPVVTPWTSD
jgi:hypothetical protein